MIIRRKNHLLIGLEANSYSRRVLLKGALLAKSLGYTFEVYVFYSTLYQHAMFMILNIYEIKKLSKRLGTTNLSIQESKNERVTIKRLTSYAKRHQITEIVVGNNYRNRLRKTVWFDKFNYILRRFPKVAITVISSNRLNPFESGDYENGKSAYISRLNGVKSKYTLNFKPIHQKAYQVLFFKDKKSNFVDGLVALVRKERVIYFKVINGEIVGTIKAKRQN
ncbi:hypothetical protein ABEW32_20495 [Paenibacillus jamilae]|uniref:hypothetical protein n=1 Tax=Paenibacillus jamilae TaxID=114136 RepID=UPI003D2C2586